MFWERFYRLCMEVGSKPNPVAKNIGVSSAAVTKWKNGTIPPAEVLIKISNYFNCSIDYLLGQSDVPTGMVGDDYSEHEKKLIAAYRNKPEMQESIDKLLDIAKDNIDVSHYDINSDSLPQSDIKQFAEMVKSLKESGELMPEDAKIAAFGGRRDMPKSSEELKRIAELEDLKERIKQLEKELKN